MDGTAAFERCSPGARAVLSIAAVCGQEFDLATVQHAAALPPTKVSPADVLTSVGELEQLGLVTPVPRSTTRYRTADAEVLLSALGVAARTELHLRVAESLQRSGGSIGQIADHLSAALPLAPATRVIDAARLAADRAEGRRAYAEAVRFNQVALHAVPFQAAPDPARHAELLVRLGETQMLAGNRAAALDSFQSAIAIDSPQRPELAVRSALAYSSWPSVPVRDSADAGLRALIEHALGLAGPVESGSRAMLMARLAQSYRWSVDADRAWALLDDAERLAVRVDDRESLAAVLLARRLLTGRPDADVERLELSGRACGALGDAALDRPLALLLHFADQLSAGNLAAATVQVARLTDAADERESSGSRYFALRSGAGLALLSGHLNRAEDLAADALVYGRRAEHPRAEVGFRLQQLHVAAMRGGLDESIVWWRDLGVTSALATGVLAWAEAIGGSADAARAAVNDVWALDLSTLTPDAAWLPTVSMIADAVVTLDMSDHVAELRAVIEPHAHRIPTIYTGMVCLGSMHRIAGRLATAARDWDAAESHLLAAITANDRLGAVLLAASSRVDYAVMLQRRGFRQDGARSAGLLDHALAACRSRGAAGLAERIDRVRATAGDLRSDSPAESSNQPVHDGLSPREIDVIRRIARGMSNKAIAADLYISAATVQRHTINLYRKIGASGRSDAAVYAARHNLISGA